MKEAENIVSEPAPEPIAEPEPEIAAVAKKDSVQEAVDKVQASKEGHIGTLDGGEQEGAGNTSPPKICAAPILKENSRPA